MYRRLLDNPILANLAFALVLLAGAVAYYTLPRQQDPSVNFNWVEIHTRLPGATALEVEKRVTDVLEQGVQQLSDVRFSMSESRPGISRIVVRFQNMDQDAFDNHVIDLRREVQSQTAQLPDDTETPEFQQINSDNQKPSVMLLAVGHAFDDTLRQQADRMADDIERLPSVDWVDRLGMRDRELQVRFDPARMQGLGVSPVSLSDTVRAYFRDSPAGSLRFGDQQWLVRLAGAHNDPVYLENLPLVSASGEVPLRSVADVVRGFSEPTELVRYQGKPAILLAVYKNEDSNLLQLVRDVKSRAESRSAVTAGKGVRFVMLDDQTSVTREALGVMEDNALVGLALVFAATWLMLGIRMAVISTLGIPFALAGTLAIIALIGETLNVVVLLGLVVSLGMLVDDAVVVAETIHYRLQRGQRPGEAVVEGIREVGAPVLSSVLTTMAAFLPLMLLPGVLGDYMFTAPLVVVSALALSLAEAFWILPAHAMAATPGKGRAETRSTRLRAHATWWLRNRYARLLIWALRRPRTVVSGMVVLFALAVVLVQSGLVRIDYFATDSARLFYVNVDMPPGTTLEKTLDTTVAVQRAIRPHIRDSELRAVASYAGLQIAKADTVMSDNVGQVAVSLRPRTGSSRSVRAIIDAVRDVAHGVPGPKDLTFLEVRTGPPTEPPVKVKVRGDDYDRLTAAVSAFKHMLAGMPAVHGVRDDDLAQRQELTLSLDHDALVRGHLNPANVTRAVQLLADGEVVAGMRADGENLDVRVRADHHGANGVGDFLGSVMNLPGGGTTTLGNLVSTDFSFSRGDIRHQNFRRAITVTAELDQSRTDTLSVNRAIRARWEKDLAARFPNVDLDFSGEMDDIKESLNNLGVYFVFGLLLIYLILGTQFRSYLQPVMVLVTVPIAFTGLVIGVAVSGHALSLYTLYGAIALAGIAVNSAIVFVSSANQRIRDGMGVAHATVLAARRRVVPILITSITTMAGLFSLAVGLAGESNIWGPVASAIVWGLGASTALTLLITPLIFARFPPKRRSRLDEIPQPVPLRPAASPLRRLNDALAGEWRVRRRYREDLKEVAETPNVAMAYERGCRAFADADVLTALRCFQYAAEARSDLALTNRAAAHAGLALLHELGWDAGYDARVRRFLKRAEVLGPDCPDIQALGMLYTELRAEVAEDAPQPDVPGYVETG